MSNEPKIISGEEAAIALVKGENLDGYHIQGDVTITEELWERYNPLPVYERALVIEAEVKRLYVEAKVR